MPVDENEEGLTFLDESDAAVQQLRDLSSVLEERLKTRQAPLSQLPAPPRPSAFTTEADRRLLSTSPSRHFANKPFPSAVDRLPGHTPHAYSFSRTSTSLAGEGGGALKPPPATADSTRSSTGPPPTAGSIGIRFSYMPRGQARSRSSSPDRSAWSPPKRPSALSLEIKDAAAACAAPRVRAQAAAASAATLGLDPYGEPLPLVLPTSKGSTARTHHSSSRNITPSTSPFIQQPAAQIWSAAVPTLAATQRPGQRKYVQLFHTAKSSRVGELSNFKKEMEDIDLEIKQYVSAFKYDLNLPDAALHLQTVWRARGPRLLLKRFTALRTHCLRRRTAQYFVPLLQLVRAPFHARHRLMHRCLEEWREIMSLKLDLYRKLIAKLKASMIDVRDSQSPNHLWRLCTAPGQDPWKANLNLGRLVSNIILSQAPWRKMKLYFHQWLNSVRAMLSQRQKGSDVLASMESKRSRERVHNAFRFWFRYAIVQVSERLQVDPPLFRPRMPEWEKWYYEHNRTRELEGRIEILHKDFRLRYCLQWWHLFTSRNIKMRKCWISAAADQIEGVMRHGMSAFKANWRYSKYRKLTRAAVFRAWLHITKRNVEVRKLALQVEKTTRRSIMAQCMRRLRQWQRASSLISTAATIHIWQRRTLALGPMCAWMGDGVQMLFVLTWQRWKQAAVSRIRFKTFLTGHLELQTRRSLDLSFKAWRKVTYQRVETRKLATKRATKQLSDLIKQERELGAENGGTLVKWSAMVRQSPKTVQRLSVQSVAAESSRPDTPGSTILSSVEPAHSTAINGMVPEGDRNASIADAVEPANVTTDAAGNNAPPSFVPHVVRTLAPFTEDVIEDDGLGSSVQQLLLDHWGDNYIVLPPLSESGERDIGELHLPPDVFTVTYEEVLEAAVKATVQAFDDDVEDIWVTAGDFPMNHNWRPLIGRVKMMQEHDVSTVGMSDMRIGKLLEHLLELDGPFTPGHNNKQLVLDVYRRIEVDMYQRVELAHGSTGKMWLEQPEPDPTIWQRLIGLRYTLLEPSPDFIGHFIDIRSVPLFEEVLPIKIFLMRERSSCSAPPELELEPSGATTTSSTSNRVAVAAFTTLKASSRFHGLAPLEAEASMYAEEKRIHARHAKDDAVMSEDDRTLMLLYKMGEAEQILETCLCAMLNLGFDMITPMYRVLKKKLTSSRLPPMLKGDYLVKVLKAAIVHDHNYMHANMLYRGNRDRVITMGVELQDKAWAVHYHRPEFTLTYPNVKPIRAVGEEGRGTHHDKSDEDSEEEQLKPFEGPAFKTASNAEGAAAAVDPASKLPRGAAGQVPMSPSKATAGVVPSTSLGAQAMPVTCVRTAAAKLPHALTIPAAPLAALNTFTPAPKALPAPSVSTISRSELIKLQLTTPNMTSPKAPPRSPPVMSPARQRLMARVRKDAWRPGGNRMARKDMSMSLSLGITTSCNGSMRYRSRNTSVSGAGNKSPGCSIPNSPTRFASPEHLGSPPLPPPSVSTRLAALKADIVGASGMDPGASPSRSAAALADTYAWFPGGRLFPSVQDVNLAETPTMMDIEHASGQLVRESLPVFFGLPMLPAVIFSTWGEPGGPAAVAAAAAAMAEEEAAALAEEELKLPEEPSGPLIHSN
ncbi:hypothetical protein CEUSTIGMA_g6217.t1 [Chlamydomonas eustigma]|uniref:Uncharacterized protein n=1 Tax=Chlamydomonas eustigma TaxID=1157962 RepID=A0A250X7P2_9CHLO|nr:hypothetical protein CEUSTIGMA_g6217.t1 [Chlamydomonas eustigma]|eukprot:GAX78780.1 hypothetical protein CEUSTIGMA_g6217.t1 [Chlamydomonas eustigma]